MLVRHCETKHLNESKMHYHQFFAKRWPYKVTHVRVMSSFDMQRHYANIHDVQYTYIYSYFKKGTFMELLVMLSVLGNCWVEFLLASGLLVWSTVPRLAFDLLPLLPCPATSWSIYFKRDRLHHCFTQLHMQTCRSLFQAVRAAATQNACHMFWFDTHRGTGSDTCFKNTRGALHRRRLPCSTIYCI